MNVAFPLQSAFLAIPLANDAKSQFQMFQQALSVHSNFLRFQERETPHCTFHFWKQLNHEEYAHITFLVEQLCKRTEPFHIQIDGCGTFGKRGSEHVLFLAIKQSDRMQALRNHCPQRNERPFIPHVTIARITDHHTFQKNRDEVFSTLRNANFSMQVSMLRFYGEVDGNKQTPLRDMPFRNQPLH